ncbi:ribosome hibernation-promoting factor, HPF/YfiA family [Intestinicryptomonas porci]|uniref:Ribosome-associated translation inhibitor RaiA n=1 Tax=Intestinicryptomonas porci TaxID=2926320 RepID=A0ABU4WHG8_9BACT|nr:ribosome-associated translation inhibitor RaiA [Opitutales bacterium]MDX8415703.1 ribosome-associated translation inhibitor RaiA [Opitutales bacterium CLA-KB-P66]
MNNNEIIISGQNLELTDSLKQEVYSKMEKLFKHQEKIIRLRIDLEYSPNRNHEDEFIAKGRIEIEGPDMVISIASSDMYKSINELADKLDRKIRRARRLVKVKTKQVKNVDISNNIPNAVKAGAR